MCVFIYTKSWSKRNAPSERLLFQDMSTSSFQKPFIDVRPGSSAERVQFKKLGLLLMNKTYTGITVQHCTPKYLINIWIYSTLCIVYKIYIYIWYMYNYVYMYLWSWDYRYIHGYLRSKGWDLFIERSFDRTLGLWVPLSNSRFKEFPNSQRLMKVF